MELLINDFNYELPAERIALFPTDKRDDSKLLVFDGQNIHHKSFKDIPSQIPKGSLLVFNNSKVVPARILFQKSTGSTIEIFVLGPEHQGINYHTFFNSQSPIRCKCTIGNKKRWPQGEPLNLAIMGRSLRASLVNSTESIVEFSWDGKELWGDILQTFGSVPLPPYIKRAAEEIDKDRYQTIYSSEKGAVAAPTAGLHFTSEILAELPNRGIKTEFITLHVGAGTFLPVKTTNALDHPMHEEVIIFTRENIQNLVSHDGPIIPVGTTSCRSLESLYWFGCQLFKGITETFYISHKTAFQTVLQGISRAVALKAVASFMDKNGLKSIQGSTSIYIYPSYAFKMTDALITNFHQPASTLILLVATLVGNNWREIYAQALAKGYRFLSYGDSSLLFPIRNETKT